MISRLILLWEERYNEYPDLGKEQIKNTKYNHDLDMTKAFNVFLVSLLGMPLFIGIDIIKDTGSFFGVVHRELNKLKEKKMLPKQADDDVEFD